MRVGYTGLDDTARKIDKIYVGVNNIAHRCVRGYVGVNNKATLIYPVDQDVPTVSGHYTYDREVHEAIISNYDEDMIAVSGTTKTANAGVYTITFTLKSSMYRWIDGTSTPKTATWAIDKKVVGIPSIIPGTYVYNGSVQSASFTAYDPYAVAITGEPMAADAGTHYVYFNLTSTNNYVWSDGTVEEKTDSWAISPLIVACPTVAGSYVYNGKSQTVEISAYDRTIISASGTMSAVDVGSYSVIFSLINPINYHWDDGTSADKAVPWAITKAILLIPTLSGTYTYNGKTQTVTISKYDESLIQKGGAYSAINAKTYTVTFSLINPTNYCWPDGTTTTKSASWTIDKQFVVIPSVASNPTYQAKTVEPTLANYNSSTVKKSGDVNGVDVKTYTIKFGLIDPSNYKWSDGTITQKKATWQIYKKVVVIPTLSNKVKTYNGSVQKPTISAYSSSEVVVGGVTEATNGGTYTVTFNLTSAKNYVWSDGSVTEQSDSWVINKVGIRLEIPENTHLSDLDWGYTTTVVKGTCYDVNGNVVKAATFTYEIVDKSSDPVINSLTYNNGVVNLSITAGVGPDDTYEWIKIKVIVKGTSSFDSVNKTIMVEFDYY